MINSVIIAGFGGQGVMLTGQLLGYASVKCGRHALFLPAYGPEQRGGTASCTVTLSDEEIESPIVDKLDALIAMNEPSLRKFIGRVKENGIVLINEDMNGYEIDRKDLQIHYIPVNSMALEIGSIKVANIIMLGAYVEKTKILSTDELINALKIKLAKKPEFLPLNEKAIEMGMKAVR